MITKGSYRGRIAPSPTGFLHVGHARTFQVAFERARAANGTLILRNENLDHQRSRRDFEKAMLEDLRWLGIRWSEGPDVGGPFSPYVQSERRDFYLDAWRRLRDMNFIYPCTCSRKDVAQAVSAPNELDDEPMYSGRCRTRSDAAIFVEPAGVHWRFRVPDGEVVAFQDQNFGPQRFTGGKDFGDFIIWRRDDVASYQLAVVVDDAAMQITEVVRGADLLKSTARQILLFTALGFAAPLFYHCDLVRDAQGVRLAKRHDGLSIRALRDIGCTPEQVLHSPIAELLR